MMRFSLFHFAINTGYLFLALICCGLALYAVDYNHLFISLLVSSLALLTEARMIYLLIKAEGPWILESNGSISN